MKSSASELGLWGVTECSKSEIFESLSFHVLRKRHVTVGFFLLLLALLSDQPIFFSFVVISAVLCHCLKAILRVGIYPNRASRRKLGKFGETMGREGALALFENL